MPNLAQQNQINNEKILILTLKDNDGNNQVSLVINLKDFYVQGFINKVKDGKEQYFYFKDSQVKKIRDKNLNIQDSINLGYDSNYSDLIPEVDLMISSENINDSIVTLSKHNTKDNNKIKKHLVRLIFITSEAMRFQCDEKSLEVYAKFKSGDNLKVEELEKKIENFEKLISFFKQIENITPKEKEKLLYN